MIMQAMIIFPTHKDNISITKGGSLFIVVKPNLSRCISLSHWYWSKLQYLNKSAYLHPFTRSKSLIFLDVT